MALLDRLLKPYQPQRTASHQPKCMLAGMLASEQYLYTNLDSLLDPAVTTPRQVVAMQYKRSLRKILYQKEGWLAGAARFGVYEMAKDAIATGVGEEWDRRYPCVKWVGASVCAELVAVMGLLPWGRFNLDYKIPYLEQAFKARGTSPPGKPGTPKYSPQRIQKNIRLRLARNISYTAITFTTYESLTLLFYTHLLQNPKTHFTGLVQMLVGSVAGYLSGVVFYAANRVMGPLTRLVPVVSNPLSFTSYTLCSTGMFTAYNLGRVLMETSTMGAEQEDNTDH